MRVGTVSELWRYPVKSMRGDRVTETAVTERWGLPGDRGWVIRDEDAGELRSAKKWVELLQFHARYVDDRVHELLSAALGRRVSLHPRRPADDHEHYRRLAVDEADLPRDRGILRSLARENDSKFGAYLRSLTPGTIRERDDIRLV